MKRTQLKSLLQSIDVAIDQIVTHKQAIFLLQTCLAVNPVTIEDILKELKVEAVEEYTDDEPYSQNPNTMELELAALRCLKINIKNPNTQFRFNAVQLDTLKANNRLNPIIMLDLQRFKLGHQNLDNELLKALIQVRKSFLGMITETQINENVPAVSSYIATLVDKQNEQLSSDEVRVAVKTLIEMRLAKQEQLAREKLPVDLCLMEIEVTSTGFKKHVGEFGIKLNGVDINKPYGRGLNVAIIDSMTGKLKDFCVFDTCGDGLTGAQTQEVNGQFIAYIDNKALQQDIIAIAVNDDASDRLDKTVKEKIKSLGSLYIDKLGYRCPWLYVGTKSGIFYLETNGKQEEKKSARTAFLVNQSEIKPPKFTAKTIRSVVPSDNQSTQIVSGNFGSPEYRWFLTYCRENGACSLLQYDKSGELKIINQPNIANQFDIVVPVLFQDASHEGLFCYKRTSGDRGEGVFYKIDSNGLFVKCGDGNSYMNNWSHIIPIHNHNTKGGKLFFYSAQTGFAELYALNDTNLGYRLTPTLTCEKDYKFIIPIQYDHGKEFGLLFEKDQNHKGSGRFNKLVFDNNTVKLEEIPRKHDHWRSTWKAIVPINSKWSKNTILLFCEANTGYMEFYQVTPDGAIHWFRGFYNPEGVFEFVAVTPQLNTSSASLFCLTKNNQAKIFEFIDLELALNAAWQHHCEGNQALALEILNGVLTNHPKHAQALSKRGWVHHSSGANDKALQDLDAAIHLKPDLAEAYDFRGWVKHCVAQTFQDNVRAFADYETFSQLCSKPHPDCCYRKGWVAHNIGNNEEARKQFEYYLQHSKDTSKRWDALWRYGWIFHCLGQNEEAKKHLEESLNLKNDSAIVLGYLGWVLHKLGDNNNAIDYLNRSITKDANNINVVCYRALVNFYGFEKFQEAEKDFTTTLQKVPRHEVALDNYAWMLCLQRKYQLAFEVYSDFFKFYPGCINQDKKQIINAEIFYRFSVVLCGLGKFDEALSFCDQFLQHVKNGAHGLTQHARILHLMNRDIVALEEINRVIESNKQHAEAWECRADIRLCFLHDHQGAYADYQQYFKLLNNKSDIFVTARYGWVQHLNGHNDKALDKLNKFLVLHPEDILTLTRRAWVLHKLGNNQKALDDLQEVLKRDPLNVDASRYCTWIKYELGIKGNILQAPSTVAPNAAFLAPTPVQQPTANSGSNPVALMKPQT